MALVASSISGAAYVMNNAEDKDTGNGFEVGIETLRSVSGVSCLMAVHKKEEMASVAITRISWIRLILP